jgi:hypothetical protein
MDLEALQRVLAPIEQVGREEITFEAEGHTITLQPLLPKDEVLVQKWAQTALEGHEDEKGTDRYAALDFFNKFRIGSISFALIEVDGTDFRGVDFIETTDTTASGKKVRVTRAAALRKIITAQWSRSLVMATFGKYGELMSRVEERGENLVEYEPSDLDAELERVRRRVTDLEAEKERRSKGDANIMAEQVRAITEVDAGTQAATRQARQGPPPAAPVVPPRATTRREDSFAEMATAAAQEVPGVTPEEEWATFDEVPTAADLQDTEVPPEAPPVAIPPSPASAPQPQQPQPQQPQEQPQPQPPPQVRDPLSHVQDSFGDPDDPEVLAAEEQRILAARQKAMAAASTGRTPPHMKGAMPPEGLSGGEIRTPTAEELAARGIPPHLVGQNLDGEQDALEASQRQGMAKPTETLSGRGKNRQAPELPPVDARGDQAKTQNTRFQPPKG